MSLIVELKKLLSQVGLEYFSRYYSIYRATVVSNEDPEYRGRLLISCPTVYGSDTYHYWADAFGLPSGKTAIWAIPAKGDTVWVQFEGGDVRYPIWAWGWFKKDAAPQNAHVEGKAIKTTVFQSASGHRITMNDKDNTLTLSNASGIDIVLKEGSIEIAGNGQKAVLGDRLKTLLDTLITTLKTSTDAIGNPFNPATIAALEAIQTDIILSNTVKLK